MNAVHSMNNYLNQFVKDNITFMSNGRVIDVDKLNSVDVEKLYNQFFDKFLIYQDYFNEIIRFSLEELSIFKRSVISRIEDFIAREYYYTKIALIEKVDKETAKIFLKHRIHSYYDTKLKYKMHKKEIYFAEKLKYKS